MNLKNAIKYIVDVSPLLFITKSIRSILYNSNSKISWIINTWNEHCVANYLRHEIKNSNINFNSLLGKPNPNIPDKSIFIMWWQGEENAPALIKTCIESVRRHANKHKVIIISEENINQFVHIPEFILTKVKDGRITFTHLSDIIRLNLLTLYGGAWIDATIFCTKEIPENLFQKPFYSIHFGKYTKDPSHGRWTTFLLFAQKNNKIIRKTLEFHLKYWKKHYMAADYIMFDYLINEVISQDESLEKIINNIPIENEDVFELINHIEDIDFNIKDFIDKRNTIFYKLSWKYQFKDTDKIIGILESLWN